jgi:4-hydroxy-L-threonine phosphate dehydrogenase PdxA
LNPIAAKIASKPRLDARITAMLPKGMNLNQASMGFKNQGQFIAALHASQNLGCNCFKQIRTDMVTKHMSLGQAIQDVKKTANPTVEAHKAETEANDDVKRTTTTGASTSTGAASKTKPAQGGGDS